MADLTNQLVELKFAVKQLNKQAQKLRKEEALQKNKVKKALQDGDRESARIYAANALRAKQDELNILRLSARVDQVRGQLQTAITMRSVSSTLTSTFKKLEKNLVSLDPQSLSLAMDECALQFEDLDVQQSVLLGDANTSIPSNEIDSLINRMMSESESETLLQQLSSVDVPTQTPIMRTKKNTIEEDDALSRRIQALRE